MALTKEEIMKAKEKDDAIVELAFLGNQKSTSASTRNSHEFTEGESANKSTALKRNFKIISAIAICAVFTLMFTFKFLAKIGEGDQTTMQEMPKGYSRPEVSPTNNDNPEKSSVKKLIPRKVVTRRFQKAEPKKIQARRFPARAKKRVVVKEKTADNRADSQLDNRIDSRLDLDKEEIDINDPEIQEEITRALAGEDDFDDAPIDERDGYIEEEIPQDDYLGDEEPLTHGDEDVY